MLILGFIGIVSEKELVIARLVELEATLALGTEACNPNL